MLSGESKASDGLITALRQAQNPDGTKRYGLATAVSLLIFFAIALQCMSTIVAVRRETNSWKIPALQFSFLFGLAYILSFAAYRLTLAFNRTGRATIACDGARALRTGERSP